LAWFTGQVNAEFGDSKEGLDRAIREFERILDPKNQPAERGFDFSKDYVVRNRLALVLYKQSQVVANPRPVLLRAVREYHTVLDQEPEDLEAHYGLYQCYRRLEQGEGAEPAAKPDATPEELLAQARTLADRSAAPAARVAASAEFVRGLEGYGRQPPRADRPKLPVVRQLLATLRPTFDGEPDGAVQNALARALGHLHREAHELYKPDELARADVSERYRAKHPAANLAAEAIVIYPTARPGAPGF
jgi:hypothetical protein